MVTNHLAGHCLLMTLLFKGVRCCMISMGMERMTSEWLIKMVIYSGLELVIMESIWKIIIFRYQSLK